MKRGLSILSAITASVAACVKIDIFDDPNTYDSILEYAVNSKTEVNNLLLGPVDISPTTWDSLDAECYVQIDNERILIINHDPYYSVTGNTHEYKILVLHYDSKDKIKTDFEKFAEFAGLDGTGHINLSAVAAEFMQTNEDKKKVILENITIDFFSDWSAKEFYFIVFDTIDPEGKRENHFIIVPAEFV